MIYSDKISTEGYSLCWNTLTCCYSSHRAKGCSVQGVLSYFLRSPFLLETDNYSKLGVVWVLGRWVFSCQQWTMLTSPYECSKVGGGVLWLHSKGNSITIQWKRTVISNCSHFVAWKWNNTKCVSRVYFNAYEYTESERVHFRNTSVAVLYPPSPPYRA